MTTTKMFVHYSGTKDAFIAAGLETKYTNKIVFIKGGESGTGAAVYTHGCYYANVEEALASLKYFGKIKAGDNIAQAAGPDGIITFTADDPASVAVKVDERGVHFALTDDFKTAVNTTLPNRIAAIEGDYLKGADKTTLQGSIASSLEEAKEYTDGKVADIVGESNSALIGTAADASSADTIYGAKKYAEEKASAAQTAAEATAAADVTSKVNAAKAEIKETTDGLEGRLSAVEGAYASKDDVATAKSEAIAAGAVTITESEGTGDVLKKYVFSQNGTEIGTINLAKDLVVSGGQVVEKEGVKYLQLTIANQDTPVEIAVSDLVDVYSGSAYIDIASDNTISVKFADLAIALAAEGNAVGNAIKAAADAAVAADTKAAQGVSDAAAAKSAADAAQDAADATQQAVDAIEADYLKKADKDALQAAIDLKVAIADYEAKITELEAMWEWEEL